MSCSHSRMPTTVSWKSVTLSVGTLAQGKLPDAAQVKAALIRDNILGVEAFSIGESFDAVLHLGLCARFTVLNGITTLGKGESCGLIDFDTDIVVLPQGIVCSSTSKGFSQLGLDSKTWQKMLFMVANRLCSSNFSPPTTDQLSVTSLLLHGPRGSGKTALIHAIAEELPISLIEVTALDLFDGNDTESMSHVRFNRKLQYASACQPCILLFDNAEQVLGSGVQRSDPFLILQVLQTIEDLAKKSNLSRVLLVFVTPDAQLLCPKLLEAVDETAVIVMPAVEERIALLQSMLQTVSASSTYSDKIDLRSVARELHGYVALDIRMLLEIALSIAVRQSSSITSTRASNAHGRSGTTPCEQESVLASESSKNSNVYGCSQDGLQPESSCTTRNDGAATLCNESYVITTEHLHLARQQHKPVLLSSGGSGKLEEWSLIRPSDVAIGFSGIGGHKIAKQLLTEMVVWPVRKPEVLRHFGVDLPRGILLHGPPGTGKTLLARAVAKEASANFLNVSIGSVIRGHIGESEKVIARVFAIARRCTPCIVFFDEFQALFGTRSSIGSVGKKLVSQLLVETDSLCPGIVMMGATNALHAIDDALLRPGRFSRQVHIGLPDRESRIQILSICRDKMKSWDEEIDMHNLADQMDGLSGAEIDNMCQQAALRVLEREFHSQAPRFTVTMSDFDDALREYHEKPVS